MSTEDRQRYLAAAHAMQSGVATEMALSPGTAGTSAKHLRVGINSALSDASGLAALLIQKGVFTVDEYEAAVADAMEREKLRYEAHLNQNVMPGVEARLA